MNDVGAEGLWAARSPDRSLAELAARQEGVVSRGQLHLFGVSRHLIRSQLRARRWRLVARSVVLLDRGPVGESRRRWVAVLAAGPHAALCGVTAANLDGLRGFSDHLVHVLVPRGFGTRVPRLPGVQVHESRRFLTSDVHPTRMPPRTRTARSVIDAAGWSANATRAAALIAATVQQRLVPVSALRAELGAVGRLRHRRLLALVLDDVEGGAHSLAELRMGALVRRAGLPPATRQAVRTDAAGRRRYLDMFWSGLGLWVEIDGGFHWHGETWCDDMLRQNEITIASPDISFLLRFPSLIIRTRPGIVIDQLTRAARQALPHRQRPSHGLAHDQSDGTRRR
ncbi:MULTISPECIES: hypothetical protein [Pseudofrankia]|uniref:hypothetical protein n=1 Tax=Pseudofrankia TaxID=2994363 RepID=UPI000686D319|nr:MULTISPECIES: hypothetical protein [Pseudofrankia]OHV41734.1 hypothetical protein BCD49_02190 [Pseudofrankia sp. EUN1h]